ncbi:uncharacterized protein BP01DRAFT_360387 [Aspergillus saccharolyticus JOP 1030-1]|uniref:Uncharacterized protein n=1 Tax=Aspergillus saccharolyticus JOP 1030-1 TaxID=1450539 RepID=A0A319A1M5_9EURO|nr:hypothetical protein BP01DRAFT_360387 [Aspergillus saccharolyticus JOP 1030-1]PYH41412.1 hypothetical protein BP01DRAFT_360387 [Aspergillus saccharolyticus JOP 1030-1]
MISSNPDTYATPPYRILKQRIPGFFSPPVQQTIKKMPSKPINSPPLHPKKVDGFVRDDAPVDDYENTWKSQEEEEDEEQLPFNAPNIAAARRMNNERVQAGERDHYGTTGSKNRSTTGH